MHTNQMLTKSFSKMLQCNTRVLHSWTTEVEEALARLKALLTNPPVPVPPTEGEHLLLYVTATTQVVSAAIVVER